MDWLDSQYEDGPSTLTHTCLVAHNNLGYDAIVLDNNLVEFGVADCRAWKFDLADSLEIMRNALFGGMPANHPKDLNSCMQYFFDEPRPTPHSALKD
eukprot:00109.XXX_333_736_1 [CDS] Oithona nana genome sequencing.